jgi:hypothetical protein
LVLIIHGGYCDGNKLLMGLQVMVPAPAPDIAAAFKTLLAFFYISCQQARALLVASFGLGWG